MRPNPLSDALAFLTKSGWTTVAFWILIVASIGIAIASYRAIPAQRRLEHLCNWGCRFLIGAMWWQQTLWKLPPYYTDQPQEPFGSTGLAYWMIQEGKGAAFQLQADLVNNLVLPNFYLFAPAVYALETLTAISLMLGLGVRLWGAIGALQIVNLWLGLYNAEGEWPWTYFFLLTLQVIFAVNAYGRSLGADALLRERAAPVLSERSLRGLVLRLAT